VKRKICILSLRAAGWGCLLMLAAPLLAQGRDLRSAPDPQPRFLAGETRTPGGKQIGYVDMEVGKRKKRVVEVLASAGGLSLQQRAQKIADRMRKVHTTDPAWWKRLSTGRTRGLWVVRTPKAPGGFLITADPKFAREWGVSSQKLAVLLMHTIHNTFDPPRIAMRDIGDLRAQAVEMRIQGDNAYQGQDAAAAETDYLKAVQIAPGYLIPYLRLAYLYAERNQPEKARAMLRKAQELHPDSEQQEQITQLLQRLNSR